MKPSNRIANILGDGSDGWEIFYRSRAMKAAGIDITELTIGEHDTRTDPTILDAMHASAKGGHTGYAMIPGIAPLREIVARRVQERTGVPTTSNNVLITAGGQAALFAAHLATCDEGSRALFIDPYYATYPGTIRAVGAIPTPIKTRAEDGFIPRAADIAAAAAGARSLLINTPNNPTGAIYARNTLTDIAQVCIDHNLWLISDEVYDTQIWNGPHISPRALPDMAQRTLVIGSMSKSFAMTGSRIGWIVGPEEMIKHLVNLSTHTNYGVAGFVQDAALFALQNASKLEEKIAAPFRRRRDLTLEICARYPAVRVLPADGAMYAMIDIRKTGLSGEDFANQLLDQEHIAVMPAESFGSAAAGHIRVAMTIPDDRYQRALETLCQFATKLAR